MLTRISLLLFIISKLIFAQHNLNDFLNRAMDNSPVLKDHSYQLIINQIQHKINSAEFADFHVSLSGDYLFVPYFNNNGDLVTTNPSEHAVGYDINLFDGGLYSLQLNLERNIFNGRRLDVLEKQIQILDDNIRYGYDLEKHNLMRQVTDQYLNTYQTLLLIDLSSEIVSNLNEQLELTSELIEQGFENLQDYLLLKIEVKNQSINLSNARQNYRSSLYQLYALCGIQDTVVVDIDSITLKIDEQGPKSNFMERYHLDSLLSVNQQDLFEVKYKPEVRLFFNTGLNAVELHNIQRRFGMSAGLSLSLPLYDGRQRSLTRQQSQVNQNTISEYRQYFEKNIAIQRKDMRTRILSLQQNIESLKGQISDYEKLLKLSEKQLQQGNVSMIDHLILLRNFMEIRKSKIETEINCQHEINNYNYWNW